MLGVIFKRMRDTLKGLFQVAFVEFFDQCLDHRGRFQFIICPVVTADITHHQPFTGRNQGFQKHVAVAFRLRNITNLTFSDTPSFHRFPHRYRYMAKIQMILSVGCRETSLPHPHQKHQFERNRTHRQVGGQGHPFRQVMATIDFHPLQLLDEKLPSLLKREQRRILTPQIQLFQRKCGFGKFLIFRFPLRTGRTQISFE